jgi:hypothetical protein
MHPASPRVQKPGTNHAYKRCHASTVRVGTRMAVDGHGHAMTVADYVSFRVLIVLAIWAGAMLYMRSNL